jgi:hypothetical protein
MPAVPVMFPPGPRDVVDEPALDCLPADQDRYDRDGGGRLLGIDAGLTRPGYNQLDLPLDELGRERPYRWSLPPPQRDSTVSFCPSIQPSSWSPSQKASHRPPGAPPRIPIRRTRSDVGSGGLSSPQPASRPGYRWTGHPSVIGDGCGRSRLAS